MYMLIVFSVIDLKGENESVEPTSFRSEKLC